MAVDMEKEKEEEMDKEQDSRPSMDGQDTSSSFVARASVMSTPLISHTAALCPGEGDNARGLGSMKTERATHSPPDGVAAFDVENGSPGRQHLRVFEVWSRFGGRNRFRCGGRCVTGPQIVDFRYNLFAWIAILVPTLFDFVFCAPRLWTKLSPIIVIATAVLLISTLTFLLLTSCTDPGILPRPEVQALVDGMQEEVAKAIGCEGISLYSMNYETEVMDNLQAQGYTWCAYCSMVRPPRTKHCRDCDVCILRNDHHCPFVNNCVGQRNYRYFCGFILSLISLGLTVFFGIIIWLLHLDEPDASQEGAPRTWKTIVTLLVCIPSAVCLVAVVGLGIFHTVLILMGRTTREMITGNVQGDGPTFFAERGPSLIQARKEIRSGQRIEYMVSPWRGRSESSSSDHQADDGRNSSRQSAHS